MILQRMASRIDHCVHCLWQDFYNLVDVYLDAVFHPNCVRDPQTFAQEGWHLELEKPEVPTPALQSIDSLIIKPQFDCLDCSIAD